MLTVNALMMKTVIYSVNNTLWLPADQHIVGENYFFQEPSKKGVAWETGYFVFSVFHHFSCGRY